MSTARKIATLAVAISLGLSTTPTAVFAGPFGNEQGNVMSEVREEAREGKKSLFAQFRASMSSRTGEMKKFFGFGRAAVGSGKLTAKTDTKLTIEKDGKTYTVNISDKTQIRRRFWGKATLAEFRIGDTVNVIGLWTDETHTAINATLVRDISIQKRFGVFFGDVKSLNATGWVMSTESEKRADQTVTVSSQTKLVNRKEEAIVKSDIKIGDRVRVKGLWDKALNTVTEVTHVKDFSLPLQPAASVTVIATATPTAKP